jgi:paraquat-inducible protein A
VSNSTINPPLDTAGSSEAAPDESILACLECDLLQREVALPPGGKALCSRCGAELYRDTPNSIDRALAFTLAAAALLVLGNAFPIVGLDIQGHHNATTLIGTVQSLYQQDKSVVAALVLVTSVIAPALQVAALAYMLLPLRLGRPPPAGVAFVFRLVQSVRPWAMVEVLMLGVLVSLVKLAGFAHIIPGVALWSVALLMFMLAAAGGAFNPRDVWSHLPVNR